MKSTPPVTPTVHSRQAGRPRKAVPRGKMLRAARRAFSVKGFASTTVGEIAEQVGIRAASLLHHFGSKEAIYREAIEEVVTELGGLVIDAGLQEGSYRERLDRLGAVIEDSLAAQPEAAQLLLREMMDEGPFMAQGGREMVLETLEMIRAFLSDGMKAGAFVPQDPHQLAISIISLHLFNFLVPALTVSPETPGEYAGTTRREAVLAHVRSLCGVSMDG